jgi:hypothetical protein
VILIKIEFKVPEWAIGKHIYIFAGSELLGIKESRIYHKNGEHIRTYLPLKIKMEDGRCNGCGDCCNLLSTKDSLFLKTMYERLKDFDEGSCPFSSDEGCVLKSFTPFSCLRSVCSHIGNCSEKLTVVE